MTTNTAAAMRRAAGIGVLKVSAFGNGTLVTRWHVYHDNRCIHTDSDRDAALAFADKIAAELIEAGDVPATRQWTVVRDTDGSPLRMEL